MVRITAPARIAGVFGLSALAILVVWVGVSLFGGLSHTMTLVQFSWIANPWVWVPLVQGMAICCMATIAYLGLGIPVPLVLLCVAGIVVGSLVDVPIWHVQTAEPQVIHTGPALLLRPSISSTSVVSVNVGGALVPVLLSLLLLARAPLVRTALITLAVAIVSYRLAVVVPSVGVGLNAFVAPAAAVALSVIFTWRHTPAVSYISATLGALIGADLFNLPRVIRPGGQGVSIGGAGVFDGVFLAGVLGALIALTVYLGLRHFVHRHERWDEVEERTGVGTAP